LPWMDDAYSVGGKRVKGTRAVKRFGGLDKGLARTKLLLRANVSPFRSSPLLLRTLCRAAPGVEACKLKPAIGADREFEPALGGKWRCFQV
jgi:hypothetical protein